MLFPDEEYLKESWVDIPKLLTAKTKLHDLVDNYKRFLNVNYPNHAKSYCTRLKNQPEGATSEAVVYSFLKANLDDVQVAEKMDVGGVDFKCKVGDAEFVAEVTCLETEAVISQSGLPTGPSYGGHYSMITDVLRTKASGKATQMSRYNCPRVLVMTCQHAGTSAILGIGGAEDLLTSETKIAIGSISNPGGNHLVTDLDNSVFFAGRMTEWNHAEGAFPQFCYSDCPVLVLSLPASRTQIPFTNFPLSFSRQCPLYG